MDESSPLLINESPLQVLPTLAVAIGLNEAIVVQQLHYLLRDPRHGKRLAEHQWIFNTYEQWVANFFPFWAPRTVERIFTNLSRLKIIISCQPEGRRSRRKYYRIDVETLNRISEGAKLAASMAPKVGLPSTKTSLQRESKETKGTSRKRDVEGHDPVWKPITGDKDEQLRAIRPPEDYPSEEEFDQFISDEQLDHIGMGKRCDLYRDLCLRKWQHWGDRKWRKIHDWQAYVRALDAKMEEATGRF